MGPTSESESLNTRNAANLRVGSGIGSLGFLGSAGRIALLGLMALALRSPQRCFAQQPGSSSSTDSSSTSGSVAQSPQSAQEIAPPTAVDPSGPPISVQSSEALFDIAVALNTCGYDYELGQSDPVRSAVRADVDEALASSPAAQDARDGMCAYIREHRLSDSGRDLAQYISLALYVTPPPALALGADEAEMPPDSTQVIGLLPLLRKFADAVQLHVIWVKHRPEYSEIESIAHDPLTKTIFETNIYLKQPTSTYDGRRFLVLLEPMLAPGQTNARIYGGDYIVVASPVRKTPSAGGTQAGNAANGSSASGKQERADETISMNMDQIRHTYLHFEIEPLVYAKASSMQPLLPLLKTVREAPLDFTYRSDIVSLLTESLIRAIEARTLDVVAATGKTPPQKPGVVKQRADLERYDQEESAWQRQAEAARQALVLKDMRQGYILTAYFYQQLAQLEKEPVSLKEYMGQMIFGMDVNQQRQNAEKLTFYPEGSADVVRRAPRQLRGLDLAEMDLIKGNATAARALAQQALDAPTSARTSALDLARANYLLARIESAQGEMDQAAASYAQTIKLSRDPRTLAWSHIYLGRIYDIQDKRTEALVEYKAALTVRDSQQDTKRAAEKGLKERFQSQRQLKAAKDDATAGDPTPVPSARPSAPVANDPTAPANMAPEDDRPLPPALPPAKPKKK